MSCIRIHKILTINFFLLQNALLVSDRAFEKCGLVGTTLKYRWTKREGLTRNQLYLMLTTWESKKTKGQLPPLAHCYCTSRKQRGSDTEFVAFQHRQQTSAWPFCHLRSGPSVAFRSHMRHVTPTLARGLLTKPVVIHHSTARSPLFPAQDWPKMAVRADRPTLDVELERVLSFKITFRSIDRWRVDSSGFHWAQVGFPIGQFRLTRAFKIASMITQSHGAVKIKGGRSGED